VTIDPARFTSLAGGSSENTPPWNFEVELRSFSPGQIGFAGSMGKVDRLLWDLNPYHRPMKRILLSWSSGKDSAWTLHLLRRQPDIELVGLLTTLNTEFDRVAMHGTRKSVLEAQAEAAQLALRVIPLPWPCSNEVYEERMSEACQRAIAERIDAIAFGDLFLADVRAYREKQLAGTGLEPLFPLWEIPTDGLARDMIAGGLRTKIVCVDSKQLPASFAGREFDLDLLRDLPSGIDPCGERGEFHTCVYAGPMFASPVALKAGEVVNRDGFVFADFDISTNANRH
jgi:uncharacterized protein (TIGR00290 family)